MNNSFKNYLNESEISFYNLYNKEFPSPEAKKIKDPKKKKEALDKEENEYQDLLTKFLMYTRGAMN